MHEQLLYHGQGKPVPEFVDREDMVLMWKAVGRKVSALPDAFLTDCGISGALPTAWCQVEFLQSP
ncbi:hypothetical protein CFIMG_007306RA00001 [Ceratocystis fimbriata CBS 114723]|uniref:Uncharacterized protein n=1 Tax=Ceratocystis fimbriata CBS 114723 TaxID=1035309 RepID=A0A2C5XHP3_9PEZI|nr:hypothetical protein CFIMG_007306RA00001 [Ceratocystis fimbriata CBS 114723]